MQMNVKNKEIMTNINYILISNVISVSISVLITLFLPKYMGLEEFSYWQLYVFYSTYIGILHIGLADGIYLRYGGDEYDKLNKNKFFSQFYILLFSQIVVASIIILYNLFFLRNSQSMKMLMVYFSIALVIQNSTTLLHFILQATNRIKEFSISLLLGRIVFFLLVLVCLIFTDQKFDKIIMSDLIGKIVTLIYVIWVCRDIVFQSIIKFRLDWKELTLNISAGIKLMLANIISLLIIGVVRLGIEKSWDIVTFGQVSLLLSVSSLLMLFMSSFGILLFPLLRREDSPDKLKDNYLELRKGLLNIALISLLFYYPLKYSLNIWLPEYSSAFEYMMLVFPILLYEGKYSLLTSTYLKNMRKESLLMKVNVAMLLLSILLTYISVSKLHSLPLSIFLIFILLSMRENILELYLHRFLKIKINKNLTLESTIVLIFVISNWYLNEATSFFILLLFIAFYISKNGKKLFY